MSSKILIVESSDPSANIFQAGETTGGLVAKNPPTDTETQVRSLVLEDSTCPGRTKPMHQTTEMHN